MLNFLHISDLHYTATKEGLRRDYSRAAVSAILALVDRLRAEGVVGSSLQIAITGDLVQSGEISKENTESDFEAVQRDLLDPLIVALKIDKDQVFIVPGNHEVDRHAVDPKNYIISPKTCSEAELARDFGVRLNAYFDFIDSNGYRSISRASPRVAFFDIGDQQIVCFNALAGSYSRAGLGDKGQLFVLPTELAGDLAGIKDRAIVLMHHPLSWFSDDCEMLMRDLFASKRCRVLTGHIHNEGLAEISTAHGSFVTIQAGATSEVGDTQFAVALAWLPTSNSAAVRHFQFDQRQAIFPVTPAANTQVSPKQSQGYFERTEAFYDPNAIIKVSAAASTKVSAHLKLLAGVGPNEFVTPDIMFFPEDHFSGKRVTAEALEDDPSNIILSGDELSGKSSLLAYLAWKANSDTTSAEGSLSLFLDFREFSKAVEIKEFVIKKLGEVGLTSQQAEYLLSVGKIRLYIDNIDSNDRLTIKKFLAFSSSFPSLRWVGAVRGGDRFMPSRAPSDFVAHDVSYYQMAETTLPTVLKLIQKHEAADNAEKPRAVVQRVFQSIHNLSAPRTMFYVRSMLDIFLNDASVEPLNRYLLIENLISDRIREAHKEIFPGNPVDIQMLDAFIGSLAFYLLEERAAFVTKAEFLTLVEGFIVRKGIQRKRFDPDKILEILIRSCVLREYSSGYGFMILSIEDYFLAKHMGHDEGFRARVLTADGLLTLPTVAEYYIAQNPNDRARIDRIFEIVDNFEREVSPIFDMISESATAAIRSAAPGRSQDLKDDLLDEIAELDSAEEPTMIRISDPTPVGKTKRVRRSAEEQGATFLQLGASILGVTRTLDQEDRIAIFARLRRLLLICVSGIPLLAQHLADGNEVRLRGTTIKAEYIGKLAIQEDRFYIILRGMLHNLFKNFSTWSGSPSFFNSAVRLRDDEQDEVVLTALFAQNIEADLAESLSFIARVPDKIDSLILQEIVVRLYLDAMTLVPLEREDEARAVDKLVDLTASMNPPKNASSTETLKRHKDKLRQNFSETIGINTYIGRRIKPIKG